ncbi:hypothetical protein QAD02_010144 [Eretmocerus hayati]|uniref:Uncharacterized protein n=1 Tax=Eretmocerus hayati TaxID=131215 RepID=A0ACC2NBN2_9HYME|nr:hypothetical protein QAD02_010144 [Eretmocerus hayati]
MMILSSLFPVVGIQLLTITPINTPTNTDVMSSTRENHLLTQTSTSDTFFLLWFIHQPDFFCENEVQSQEFRTGVDRENVWYLKFAVGKILSNGDDYYRPAKLYLCLKDCKKSPQKVNFKFSILNGENKTLKSSTSDLEIEKNCAGGFEEIFHSIWARENYCKIVRDNKLTIKCKIRDINDEGNYENVISLQAVEHDLISDFEKVLQSGEMSDVTLAVGKKEFKVHKFIICTRSVVFRAMFENDMLEKKLNHIDIEDVDDEVMEKVLTYLYTDRLQFTKNSALDILAAAQKYQIPGLKTLCSKVIVENLSDENMIESLISADFLGILELKSQILKVVAQHIKRLTKMKEFDTLLSSHTPLLKEILNEFCNKP